MKSSRVMRNSVGLSNTLAAPHGSDLRPMEAASAERSRTSTLADYVALLKPRVLVLLLITTLAALLIAVGNRPLGALDIVRLVVLTTVGGICAAGGAGALNQYIDRDIDALMARTRNRPLPSGRLQPRAVLLFGLVLTACSAVVFGVGVNVLSAALALAGNLFYVFVYTCWLKRATPQNIVIGGMAGAVPPLVGWAAARNDVELPAVLLFLIIALWTPPTSGHCRYSPGAITRARRSPCSRWSRAWTRHAPTSWPTPCSSLAALWRFILSVLWVRSTSSSPWHSAWRFSCRPACYCAIARRSVPRACSCIRTSIWPSSSPRW